MHISMVRTSFLNSPEEEDTLIAYQDLSYVFKISEIFSSVEFESHKYKETACYEQLLCHTASKAHHFHRFTWGNNDSFSKCGLELIHASVKKLFNDYYIASNMKLVVLSSNDLDELEVSATRCFVKLNHMEVKEVNGSSTKSSPTKYLPTKDFWKTASSYMLESLEDAQRIRISWVLPQCNMRCFNSLILNGESNIERKR